MNKHFRSLQKTISARIYAARQLLESAAQDIEELNQLGYLDGDAGPDPDQLTVMEKELDSFQSEIEAMVEKL